MLQMEPVLDGYFLFMYDLRKGRDEGMYLYRLEASSAQGQFVCVLLAESEAEAFTHAEAHLMREWPGAEWTDLALIEKKRCHAGSGYAIPSR